MDRHLIPAADFLALLPEIAVEGGVRTLARRVEAHSGLVADSVERGLRALISGERRSVGLALADRILTALDRPDAVLGLAPEDFVTESPTVCEDCGGEIEPDVMPIDLMRPDPLAIEGYAWDKTHQRWIRRKRSKPGGRRFRLWHLCRLCRASALQERAFRGSSKGVGKTLKTRERIPPKRGGRPRLLTDDELRAAYAVYLRTGLSRRELAKRLHQARDKGTLPGYESALHYGWHRLHLGLRDRGMQIAMSLHGAGIDWKPREKGKRCKARLSNGQRCRCWAERVDWRHLAEHGYCWNHRDRAEGKETP